jgi:hypothetical protein
MFFKMEILGLDVQEQIYKHLSSMEVVVVSSVCKKWYEGENREI